MVKEALVSDQSMTLKNLQFFQPKLMFSVNMSRCMRDETLKCYEKVRNAGRSHYETILQYVNDQLYLQKTYHWIDR